MRVQTSGSPGGRVEPPGFITVVVLGASLATLGLATKRLRDRTPRRPQQFQEVEPEPVHERFENLPRFSSSPYEPAPEAASPCTQPGVACLRGRVHWPRPRLPAHDPAEIRARAFRVSPPENVSEEDDMACPEVDSGAEEPEAPKDDDNVTPFALDSDGGFTVALSPGEYVVELATAGKDMAARSPLLVLSAERENQDIALRLEPALALTGNLVNELGLPLGGARVILDLLPHGVRRRCVRTNAAGTFEFPALPVGEYPLGIDTSGFREHRFIAVAGSNRIVRLERAPILLGAFGGTDDGDCPYSHLELRGGDGSPAQVAIGWDCTFVTGDLPPPGLFSVDAVRHDNRRRAQIATVDIPRSGDPLPLCLDPPCHRAVAALLVWIPAQGRGFSGLSVEGAGWGHYLSIAHSGPSLGQPPYQILSVPSGKLVSISTDGAADDEPSGSAAPIQHHVRPGLNQVVLPRAAATR